MNEDYSKILDSFFDPKAKKWKSSLEKAIGIKFKEVSSSPGLKRWLAEKLDTRVHIDFYATGHMIYGSSGYGYRDEDLKMVYEWTTPDMKPTPHLQGWRAGYVAVYNIRFQVQFKRIVERAKERLSKAEEKNKK